MLETNSERSTRQIPQRTRKSTYNNLPAGIYLANIRYLPYQIRHT